MCQHRVICYNKCATLVGMLMIVEAVYEWRGGVGGAEEMYWKCILSNFSVNLELLLKMKSIKKKDF